jgi:hypothetical protein
VAVRLVAMPPRVGPVRRRAVADFLREVAVLSVVEWWAVLGQWVIWHRRSSFQLPARAGGALAAPVGASRFVTRTTHEQWGWCAPSRGLMTHLVKQTNPT